METHQHRRPAQPEKGDNRTSKEDGTRMMEARKDPLTLILGLLLVCGLLWHLQIFLGWVGFRLGPDGPPSVMIWNWFAVIGALGFILFVERRSLASIGLRRPDKGDVLWAAVFWLVGLGLTSIVHALVPPPPSAGVDTILSMSLPVLLGVVLTASVTEEIIFRGYAIERIRDLTGKLWIGATISFILFVIPHVAFFGPMWILYHSYTTLLIYALYLWRRNLWGCIILHVMSNMMILIPALGIA